MNRPPAVLGLIVLALALIVNAGLTWFWLTFPRVDRRADPWGWEDDEEAAKAYCAIYCGPPLTAEGEHDPACQEALGA